MKIIKLFNGGFCYGVYLAYQKTIEILKNNQNKKVYILGWLVHNQSVINELLSLNAIILDDKKKSRYELINDIEDYALVILSAHGTSYEVFELMKQKHIEYYDLTCKYVYKTHNLIKDKINECYQVLFIGKKNHPETNAILSISNQITLIENTNDIDELNFKNDRLFCTNQTTLGIFNYYQIVKKLKKVYPQIVIENDICNATTMRQNAIIKNNDKINICLVIGDKRSSNCNELFNLAINKWKKAHIINDETHIQKSWFNPNDTIGIIAAASTPQKNIDDVINYLNKLNNE